MRPIEERHSRNCALACPDQSNCRSSSFSLAFSLDFFSVPSLSILRFLLLTSLVSFLFVLASFFSHHFPLSLISRKSSHLSSSSLSLFSNRSLSSHLSLLSGISPLFLVFSTSAKARRSWSCVCFFSSSNFFTFSSNSFIKGFSVSGFVSVLPFSSLFCVSVESQRQDTVRRGVTRESKGSFDNNNNMI